VQGLRRSRVEHVGMKISHPSPAFLVATAALCLGLGGGVGYAAGSLPHNSVGSAQLKKNAVTTKKIKSGAVTGAKVAPNSLTGAQVDESTLQLPVAGPQPGTLVLSGRDFHADESSQTYSHSGNEQLVSNGTQLVVSAPLHVPAGTHVKSVQVIVTGGKPATPILATLFVVTPASATQVDVAQGSAGGPDPVQTITLTPNPTTTSSTALDLEVDLPGDGTGHSVRGAVVTYG
jgi:hypothetical protein